MGPYGKNPGRLITPLKRVRGLGVSREEGTSHFIAQRVNGLALIPLTFWLVYGVIAHIGSSYAEFMDWATSLSTATLLAFTIMASFWHAAMGLQVVVEDYVHHEFVKVCLLALIRISCFGFALLGLISVLKLAL